VCVCVYVCVCVCVCVGGGGWGVVNKIRWDVSIPYIFMDTHSGTHTHAHAYSVSCPFLDTHPQTQILRCGWKKTRFFKLEKEES
jgi:hypothetical protein